MTAGRDWLAWHADYHVPDSPLAQRLAAVQGWIRQTLDQAPARPAAWGQHVCGPGP